MHVLMAAHCVYYAFPKSPHKGYSINKKLYIANSLRRYKPFVLSTISSSTRSSYNNLVSLAVRLLGPPARFEASKLKVVLMEEEMNEYSGVIPRTYILSHCDFTANLTLTISNVIYLDQLRGWYRKDDVVGEWKKLDGQLGLYIHCFVSGPNLLLDLAAEFRYHIFSKEMPLVLEAVLNGDSELFNEHPDLMDSLVWVYFHSGLQKYNRLECWGPLKDAIQGQQGYLHQGYLAATKDSSPSSRKLEKSKSIFQALFAFLL